MSSYMKFETALFIRAIMSGVIIVCCVSDIWLYCYITFSEDAE